MAAFSIDRARRGERDHGARTQAKDEGCAAIFHQAGQILDIAADRMRRVIGERAHASTPAIRKVDSKACGQRPRQLVVIRGRAHGALD